MANQIPKTTLFRRLLVWLLKPINWLALKYILRGFAKDLSRYHTPRKITPDIHAPEVMGDFRLFELRESLTFSNYHFDWIDGGGESYLVEKGFRWNGASAFIGRLRYITASAPHDKRYERIARLHKMDKKLRRRLRYVADRCFAADVVLCDNQMPIVALIGYAAVRVFGGSHAV